MEEDVVVAAEEEVALVEEIIAVEEVVVDPVGAGEEEIEITGVVAEDTLVMEEVVAMVAVAMEVAVAMAGAATVEDTLVVAPDGNPKRVCF